MRALLDAILGAYPLTSAASGGAVLSLFWLQGALFVVVLASLVFFKLAASKKVLVFVAYLAGVFLSGALVWNVPYVANQFWVTAVSVGIPIVGWLGALVLVERGKNITNRWRATR